MEEDKVDKEGKCFKHNRGKRKAVNCKWGHSCSTCGKVGCAAWKHDEAAKGNMG